MTNEEKGKKILVMILKAKPLKIVREFSSSGILLHIKCMSGSQWNCTDSWFLAWYFTVERSDECVHFLKFCKVIVSQLNFEIV